jgi:glucosamine-6-phosphate deaminase
VLLLLKRDAQEIGVQAAKLIAAAIRKQPALRLGLATGSTMIGVYRELARMHREERLDFSQVVSFNLDEYLGIPADHPQSFRRFMQEHLFSQVNIRPGNIHIPDGSISANYDDYCASYEAEILKAGGIDLQLLGIGRNGHIGFNEPTSSLGSRTRLKVLSAETLEDNRKFFAAAEKMPDCAITVGIGTILEAQKILLLASGAKKARAVADAIEGPVTSKNTASALQHHHDVTFVVDEEASALLERRDYYRRVMEMTLKLTPGRMGS